MKALDVEAYVEGVRGGDRAVLGRAITLIESEQPAHAELAQRFDLILHERDQRRDDQGEAVKDQRRDLIAQRFAAAGGHQDQRVGAV